MKVLICPGSAEDQKFKRWPTKNFKELGRNDALIAGGKGASLGEMTNAGIPVPPGFVVLAEAFEKFLEENNILKKL